MFSPSSCKARPPLGGSNQVTASYCRDLSCSETILHQLDDEAMLPDNACSSRNVDPNVPWIPSPPSQPYPEFNPYDAEFSAATRSDGPVIPVPWVEVSVGETSRGSSPQNKSIQRDPFAKKKRWGLKKFKSIFGVRKVKPRKEENWILLPNSLAQYPLMPHAPVHRPVGPPEIPMSAWKEYGHWARPIIEGVEVRNSSSPPPDHVLQNVVPEDVFKSLRGPRGSPHPEKWIPGIQHPSLPPKPPYWRTPAAHEPVPLPWECRLNPFLEHKRVGPPLVHFDLRLDERSVSIEEASSVFIPMISPNLNQPATCPFVTEMWITAVADDPYPIFPWPMVVHNARGIVCKDVFHAIFQNFQRFLTRKEVNEFTNFKTGLVQEAFNQRREGGLMGRVWDDEDGLRRIDYFVDKVMFRGLEPSPNRGGSYTLFLGPPGPKAEVGDVPFSPPPLQSYEQRP